ncbi:hypothetical protein [Nocardia sp. NPDC057455]|uniref:hypothetical protein n=1 Tax=Nocardia sp. NPDC057455 TaxID=3346138 RepID=UPI003672F699
MTDTTNHQPEPQPGRASRWWRRARTPALTAAATATVWLANGALQELGARLIEWLW